jgi:hypothetical protein
MLGGLTQANMGSKDLRVKITIPPLDMLSGLAQANKRVT